MARVRPAFPHFPCCFTGWDNTARRGRNAIVMVDSGPEVFRSQLSLMAKSVLHKDREERVVFINAWNEWAEGMYLEPDAKFGHGVPEGRGARYSRTPGTGATRAARTAKHA